MDAKGFRALAATWARVMADNREHLIELDSVVGDSDLGLTMSDGFAAASAAVATTDEWDVGKLLYQAGKAMASAVPSTMGTLMASGLMSAGKALKGSEALDLNAEAALFRAYFDGVQSRGKAQLGDKTFLDGMYPAVLSLEQSAKAGADGKQAARLAWDAAKAAYQGTKGMLAKQGRMAIRGEASRELLDPGAAVAALLWQGYSEWKDGGE